MTKKQNAKRTNKKKFVFGRLRLLPRYWKIVLTTVLVIGGWYGFIKLFYAGDNVLVYVGLALVVAVIWLLINMWLPPHKDDIV